MTSKLLQTANCKTDDGSIVRKILETAKVFMSQHMKRGKDLKKMVLNVVSQEEKLLLLYKYYNIIIKYIRNGKVAKKCKAQMQLQIYTYCSFMNSRI